MEDELLEYAGYDAINTVFTTDKVVLVTATEAVIDPKSFRCCQYTKKTYRVALSCKERA